MSLFTWNKRQQVRKKRPDAYHKHYYVGKNVDKGIVLMAKALHLSKTRVVNEMLEYALGHILGELLGDQIHHINLSQQYAEDQRNSAIIRLIRREARRRAYDISKLI
jgi:hypothetical protein